MLDWVVLTIKWSKSFSRKKILTLSNKYKMITNPCNRNQEVKERK